MKIFIYSDLHISKTSSILPLVSSNDIYTYRQDMLIKTGEYLAEIIDQERPDMIINLGDTFDQHTVSSYDINVASKFFKCFRFFSIPHIVLVGNHEMMNYDFNAVELFGNINNITVISEPCSVNMNTVLNINDNVEIALMPYTDYKDILELPKGTFLFSHLDIAGVKIKGNIELQDGLDIKTFADYKLVFNGHIHKPSIKNNIVNVGSVSTHSFSDDNESVPQCYIFDTTTLELKTYKPTMCPLFRKVEIYNNISELEHYISTLDKSYKYILQVTCPFDIKDSVKEYLKNQDCVLNSRLNIKVENNNVSRPVLTDITPNVDIKKSFKEFLNTVDLKYPKNLYETILEEVN